MARVIEAGSLPWRALLALGIAGCASQPIVAQGDGGTNNDGASSVLSACMAIQHAILTRNATCPGSPPHPVSDEWLSFLCGRLASEVSQGQVEFDPSTLASCEAQLRAAPCDELENPEVIYPCKPVFTGTIAATAPCTDDAVCESGLCRFQYDSSTHLPICPGACEYRVPVGAACAPGSGATSCASFLLCVGGMCTMTEEPLRPALPAWGAGAETC